MPAETMTDADGELVALACMMGFFGAISLRQFEATFTKKLPKEARSYLLRVFVATESLPGDANKERQLIRDALCKLRDEWQ